MSVARSAFSLLRPAIAGYSLRSGPQLEFVRCAGHSHWQNVRHIKAEKDANKARTTERHVRLIQYAVVAGGGPDPRLNKQLANAIENAKRTQVVSGAAIEAALKRTTDGSKSQNLKTIVYEFIGEHGVLALAKCEVSNVSKFVHTLKHVCKKNNLGFAKGGVKERFEEKGFVCVTGRIDGAKFDPDEALLVAIEGGAEEMNELGENDSLVYEFTCAPDQYHRLMGALQKGGYAVSDGGTKWLPLMPIEVSEEYLEKVSAFCDDLEEMPEVVGTFTNIA